MIFRERAEELIGALSEHEIPLIVFSAGIGNIIETVMKNQLGAIPETMHIISNLMIFDDQVSLQASSKTYGQVHF